MKMLKLLSVLLTLFILLTSLANFICADSADEGMTFDSNGIYRMVSTISALPMTYEATIYFPADTDPQLRGGVIFGNYYDNGNRCFNFEVYQHGNPRLFVADADGVKYDVIFDGVNVYTGEWLHLSIVRDWQNSKVHCYINGELKQTKDAAIPQKLTFSKPVVLGSDMRDGGTMYFKGAIKNVAMYKDIRTSQELLKDSKGSYDSDNLIGFYDLTEKGDTIADKNGEGYQFQLYQKFIKNYESVTDYAYSFAVIGDTQKMTYDYPDKLHCIYDWIVDNVEEKKIKFVFGLGDITDKSTEAEYLLAKSEINKLKGVVPFSIVRGNHDSISTFNKYFKLSEYGDTIDGRYASSMLNTYHKFEVGDVKYLVINLDYGPNDDVMEWAGKLIEKNKDRNVIITTHIYLQWDGTLYTAGEGGNPQKYGGVSTCDTMWDKLISKYENIVLVLSGHDPTDNITKVQRRGVHGNIVTQILIDPQGTDLTYEGTGLVAMFYFSENGKHLDVEYYSTVREAHFLQRNQFSLEIDVIGERDPNATWIPETTKELKEPETLRPNPKDTVPLTESETPAETEAPASEPTDYRVFIWIAAGVLTAAVLAVVIVYKRRPKNNI